MRFPSWEKPCAENSLTSLTGNRAGRHTNTHDRRGPTWDGQSWSAPAVVHGNRWLTAAASLLVGMAFFGPVVLVAPSMARFPLEMTGESRWRWLAAVPSMPGFAVALRCIWDRGWTGNDTPGPVAPPTRFVVVGFCRYVQNPMYVGFAVGWIGLWVVFGHANPVATATVVAVGVHLFVAFYEEPTLRKKFGVDCKEYCRNVRRWYPRARGWDWPQ